MKDSLNHLSPNRVKELSRIVEIIKAATPVEMLILYGSFARGDWVSDKYKEGRITYEYQSDFDILVVVKNEKSVKNFSLWNTIDESIRNDSAVTTPVSITVDSISFVNKSLLEGNYFYSDLRTEGIILFDSKAFTLTQPKQMDPAKQKELAQKDFDFWYKKSQSFLKDYVHNIADGELSNAAFHLHQAAEALYVTVLLVFTGYKPKTHNLGKIESLVNDANPIFRDVFPKTSEAERERFELVKQAYVDARYKQDYKISQNDLTYLYERVLVLKELTEKVCKNKILTQALGK